MALPKSVLDDMNLLCNGFAKERVNGFVESVMNHIDMVDGGANTDEIKKEIGKALAIGYAKGYADCYENIKTRRIIF